MFPELSGKKEDALSGVENYSAAGGASPLPEPSLKFSDDWNYVFFIVVPLSPLKHYNHEPVNQMIHRRILKELGEFDGKAFPPVLESWANPMSLCIKLSCTREMFQRIIKDCREIFLDFGGSPEMFLYYQTNGTVQ